MTISNVISTFALFFTFAAYAVAKLVHPAAVTHVSEFGTAADCVLVGSMMVVAVSFCTTSKAAEAAKLIKIGLACKTEQPEFYLNTTRLLQGILFLANIILLAVA